MPLLETRERLERDKRETRERLEIHLRETIGRQLDHSISTTF